MLKLLITTITLAATLSGCSSLPTSSFNPPQTLEVARAAFPNENLTYFYFNEADYRLTANYLCRLVKVGPYKYSTHIPVLTTDTEPPLPKDHTLVAIAPRSWAKIDRNPHCLVNSNQRLNGWSAGWLNTTPLETAPLPEPKPYESTLRGHPFAPQF